MITLIISFITGIAAGIIDTFTGGGGLITVPVLLNFNLPPLTVLGTNRFQGCLGELTSSINFFLSGQLPIRKIFLGILTTIIGSILGSLFDEKLIVNFLKYIIPLMLVFLIIFLLKNKKTEVKNIFKLKNSTFFVLFGILIGFYNGFFGPSTGTLWIIALVSFLGLNLKQAIMHAKPLNFIGNITSFFIFVSSGSISYSIGIAMGLGQIIGAYTAARIVIKKDITFIKPIFLIMIIILILSATYKIFHQQTFY